jgi:nucleoside-diphosphate-sugar epimerase
LLKNINKIVQLSGASGLLGRSLIKRFLANGYTIHALSRKKRQSTKKIIWFRGDICGNIPEEFFIKNKPLIHIAGSNKHDVYNINALGTEKILIAGTKAKISNVVYVSSCAVYDFRSNKKTIHVNSKKNTLNEYSKSKLYAERIVRKLSRKSKIPYLILRPASIISEKRHNRLLKLFDLLIKIRLIPLFIPNKCHFYITDLNSFSRTIFTLHANKSNMVVNCCRTVSWQEYFGKNKDDHKRFVCISEKLLNIIRSIAAKNRFFMRHPFLFSVLSPSEIKSV